MMDNRKVRAALVGGGAFGVAAGLPYIGALNVVCCALYIGGGVLAAYLYLKDAAPPGKPYGDGAIVGVLAGVVCGVVTALLGAVVMALGLGPDTGDPAEALAQLEQTGVELPDFLRFIMASDQSGPIVLALSLLFGVIQGAIFSTIGALVGVAIFHKKDADPA